RLGREPVEGRVAGFPCPLLIREAEERERVGVLRVRGDAPLQLSHVAGAVTGGEAREKPAERVLLRSSRFRRGDRGPDRVNRVGAGEDSSEQQQRGGDSRGPKSECDSPSPHPPPSSAARQRFDQSNRNAAWREQREHQRVETNEGRGYDRRE